MCWVFSLCLSFFFSLWGFWMFFVVFCWHQAPFLRWLWVFWLLFCGSKAINLITRLRTRYFEPGQVVGFCLEVTLKDPNKFKIIVVWNQLLKCYTHETWIHWLVGEAFWRIPQAVAARGMPPIATWRWKFGKLGGCLEPSLVPSHSLFFFGGVSVVF